MEAGEFSAYMPVSVTPTSVDGLVMAPMLRWSQLTQSPVVLADAYEIRHTPTATRLEARLSGERLTRRDDLHAALDQMADPHRDWAGISYENPAPRGTYLAWFDAVDAVLDDNKMQALSSARSSVVVNLNRSTVDEIFARARNHQVRKSELGPDFYLEVPHEQGLAVVLVTRSTSLIEHYVADGVTDAGWLVTQADTETFPVASDEQHRLIHQARDDDAADRRCATKKETR